MGRCCFLKILLISALLALSFSHGFGRKLMEITNYLDSTGLNEETVGKSRVIMELMDYKDPGPNTNPKARYLFCPPPQS